MEDHSHPKRWYFPHGQELLGHPAGRFLGVSGWKVQQRHAPLMVEKANNALCAIITYVFFFVKHQRFASLHRSGMAHGHMSGSLIREQAWGVIGVVVRWTHVTTARCSISMNRPEVRHSFLYKVPDNTYLIVCIFRNVCFVDYPRSSCSDGCNAVTLKKFDGEGAGGA